MADARPHGIATRPLLVAGADITCVGGLTTSWGEVETVEAGLLCGLRQENAGGAIIAAYTPEQARAVAAGLAALADAVEAKRAGGGRA